MDLLNGKDLYKMFEYGAGYVIEKRKHLNDINVFPVPDGDTGNNLVHTLKTILRESKTSDSFIHQLDYISESALIGARGNSGVIFAQFVNGLRKASPEQSEVEIEDFIYMVEEGYIHTYNSLSNPVEGTILTIIKVFGESMKSLLQKGVNSLQELFQQTYDKLMIALDDTTLQLDILENNQVVDSGALGFTLFVKGIKSYFDKEELQSEVYETVEIEDEHHFEGDITYRYCTEGLFLKNHLDVIKLKNDLELFGDSVVIADGNRRTRVHVHTNSPDKVFNMLEKYGRIESQKVDDMYLEMVLKNSNSKRVLVTDSIADIEQKILEDNNIVVIPINIDFNDVMYLDKLTITNKHIFEKLDDLKEYPKTATQRLNI
jgi:dihydroxyacetone kinase-like predicted kinase